MIRYNKNYITINRKRSPSRMIKADRQLKVGTSFKRAPMFDKYGSDGI